MKSERKIQPPSNNLHAYGNDFLSIEGIQVTVEQRRGQGLPLRGAAVVWINGRRMGIRILPDGQLSTAHAEYF